jgi:hypothetical protein
VNSSWYVLSFTGLDLCCQTFHKAVQEIHCVAIDGGGIGLLFEECQSLR